MVANEVARMATTEKLSQNTPSALESVVAGPSMPVKMNNTTMQIKYIHVLKVMVDPYRDALEVKTLSTAQHREAIKK